MHASSRVRARAIAIVFAVSVPWAVLSCRQAAEPSTIAAASSAPSAQPAVEDGYATLTLTTTERIGPASSTRSIAVKLPFSGSEVRVEDGPRIPFQAVANNTVTTTFRSAGLSLRASVTALAVEQQPRLRLSLVLEDAHVLQQVDIPVRLTKVPMIDVTSLVGTFVMANHVEQQIGRYQRHGGSPVDWRLSGRLDWNALPAMPAAAPASARRVDLHVSVGDPAQALQEFESDMAMFPGEQRALTELTRGRQAPVETLANNTSTITYKGSGSTMLLTWSANGPELQVTSTRFVTFSDTSDAPQLYENGFSSGPVPLHPNGLAQPLQVSEVTTSAGRTTLKVERFTVTPLPGTK
jgi:hypothetical protein